MTALYLLLAFNLVVFLPDLISNFYRWQARIKIGRWKSKVAWRNAVVYRAQSWTRRTPTVKVTDQDRLIIIDMIGGRYRKSAIQHWQTAGLLLGLTDDFAKSRENRIKECINQTIKANFDSDGNWKRMPTEIDVAILAYAVMRAPWIKLEDYRQAFDQVWAMILNRIGPDGTVKYRDHMPDYRLVDSIGFICPFLVRYGQAFQVEDAIELSLKQIEIYRNKGFHQPSGLIAHGYSTVTDMPVGVYGWARGMGWYGIGIADTWLELSVDDPRKSLLENYLREFAQLITTFQKPNGSWGWMVQDAQSRSDSSATALFAYVLGVSRSIPALESLQEPIERAMAYLQSVTRRNGAIDFSQGDTKGLGLYALNFDIMPFTQGFALRVHQKIERV